MRKIFVLLLVALTLLFAVSCDGDSNTGGSDAQVPKEPESASEVMDKIALAMGALSSYETELIDQLSEKIDLARETLDQNERKAYYADCLDIVMNLAVELPTYQRKNMFVYNTDKIDASTLVPAAECTPYQSPMSFLWKVNYNK